MADRDGINIRVTKSGKIIPARLDNAGLTKIGDSMVAMQFKRWSIGVNANGNTAKRLGPKAFGVKRQYLRKLGDPRPVIRDNNMTGVLLKSFSLRKAIAGYIRAEPTTRNARLHAKRAQGIEEMIGFSGPEQINVYEQSFEQYGKVFTKAWVPIIYG